MAVRSAFCSVCNRQVNLSERDSLTCPVCSSLLIETPDIPAPGDVGVSRQLETIGPEVYLG